MAEKTLLVSLSYQGGPEDITESLAELERLTLTAGGMVAYAKSYSRPRPDAALFFGAGQTAEIKKMISQHGAEQVIVDHELRPIQQRNLEKELGVRVIDRTQLILDIFARRARTHEGKLQVELAQLSYLLPRLTGKGVELSRLGGGIGPATRGPGESKLEYDRRRLRTRISVIKRQLESLKKTRKLHREDRESVPLPLLSLVGYTNAGKSALLRALTGEQTLVEDKLFATLDLATRKLVLPPLQEVLLTDTVGFIRRLPHHLVAAFRGTLEEVVTADLLIHVVDAAQKDWDAQAAVVNEVLKDLGAEEKPRVEVFNKVDKLSPTTRRRLSFQHPEAVQVSALTGEGLDHLLQVIKARLAADWRKVTLRLPYERQDLRALVLRRGRLIKESFGPNAITMHVELPVKFANQFQEWSR